MELIAFLGFLLFCGMANDRDRMAAMLADQRRRGVKCRPKEPPMPKATLEFQLPEEESEHQAALKGGTYSLIIWELLNELRNKLKHDVPLEPHRCKEYPEEELTPEPAPDEDGHRYIDPKHREGLVWVRNVLHELIEDRDCTEIYNG